MYIVFFLFFSFLWFFPSGLANTANNVRDERTPCFLIIEVVASKHLSLTSVIILDNEVVMAGLILIDIMVLNFAPDSIKFLHLGLLWSD